MGCCCSVEECSDGDEEDGWSLVYEGLSVCSSESIGVDIPNGLLVDGTR